MATTDYLADAMARRQSAMGNFDQAATRHRAYMTDQHRRMQEAYEQQQAEALGGRQNWLKLGLTGAGIGTAIAPGIGTAIGGGIGALGGLLLGTAAGRKAGQENPFMSTLTNPYMLSDPGTLQAGVGLAGNYGRAMQAQNMMSQPPPMPPMPPVAPVSVRLPSGQQINANPTGLSTQYWNLK